MKYVHSNKIKQLKLWKREESEAALTALTNVSSRGGPTANIDKDIRADQSGSTRAAGLITERDAGKQTLTGEL